MRITGVIAEYNPFHLGHAYHLGCVRENGAEAVIAVMSGNYTERGECALFDKFTRARAAIAGGADVVLELPAVWAVSCAQRYAAAGVRLLDAAGCVDTVSFGSECGDLSCLKRCADTVASDEYSVRLKSLLTNGVSYPKAAALALGEITGLEPNPLESPNDTLAVEYINAAKAIAPYLDFFPVKRLGAAHDAPDGGESCKSASFIRSVIESGQDASALLPQGASEVFSSAVSRGEYIERSAYSLAVMSSLKRLSPADFAALPEVSEGLENRLTDAVRRAATLDEACALAKTKRYTMARIRRIFTCAFLSITEEMQRKAPGYIRVLAFSAKGSEVLSELSRFSRLPVILRYSDCVGLDSFSRTVYNTECIATDLYSMCLKHPLPSGRDMTAFAIK